MAKRVTASEFARMIGVRTDTVRRYVKNGKLTAPAVTRDKAARIFIDAKVAKAQLRRTLAAPTRGRALTGGARLDDDTSGFDGRRRPSVEENIKTEILRKLRTENARAEREMTRQGGMFVRTIAVAAMQERVADETLRLFEAQADDMAAEIAAQLKVPVDEIRRMVTAMMNDARSEKQR